MVVPRSVAAASECAAYSHLPCRRGRDGALKLQSRPCRALLYQEGPTMSRWGQTL